MLQKTCLLLRGLGLVVILITAASAAALAAPTTLWVAGRVVDEDGRPVEDARVALRRTPGLFEALDGALGDDPDSRSGGVVLDEALTDAEGLYRLEADGPGLYRVTVDADDRASQQVAIEPLVASRTLAPVALPASVRVAITVTGGGEPVPDALVAVASPLRPPTDWSTRARFARTDAEGRAEVVWPLAERRLVMVSAPGFLSSYQERPASRASRVDVALEPGEAERWSCRIPRAVGSPGSSWRSARDGTRWDAATTEAVSSFACRRVAEGTKARRWSSAS